jgi:phenylacetate-CoA ligase
MSIYPSAFRHAILPLHDKLKGKNLLRFVDEYQANLSLSDTELKALQWQRLQVLLDHAYHTTVYYKRVWTEAGVQNLQDIKTLEDFSKLPLVTKDDIREHYDEFISDAYANNIKKSTGGSTGQPFHFELNLESNTRREAVMWRGYGWLGAGLGEKALYLWGADLGQPSRVKRFKDMLYHGFYNRSMLNSFSMTRKNIPQYIEKMNAYKATVMISYVNPLFELSKFVIENKIPVHSPKSILTGAEPLHDFQREVIEQAFQCPVYNTFGCREFMLIAAECAEHKTLHINTDHLLVESVNAQGVPQLEEAGDLVISDLFNRGMPLIRYVNGDRVTLSQTSCDCGNPLPIIKRIEGRKLDVIKTRSGRMIPGELFPHMFKEFKAVERFQVHQTSITQLNIKIVTKGGLSEESVQQITHEINKYSAGELELNFIYVDTIPLTVSGKHRVAMSDVE